MKESDGAKVQLIKKKKKATKQSRHQRFRGKLNLDVEITKRIVASTKKQSATKENRESREEETISVEGSVLVSHYLLPNVLGNGGVKEEKG